MNEDAWEDLDTWERRDHEPIRDHLNDASVRLENDNWKLRMNKSFWNDGLQLGERNSHNENNYERMALN